jgi:peptidoglycan/xylan/chitin deacetylase (PgdA/CDA1 family)
MLGLALITAAVSGCGAAEPAPTATPAPTPAPAWPAPGWAAVSLTYDDGVPTDFSVVGPALRRHRLNGTFFPAGAGLTSPDNAPHWRELVGDGNEIGSHTVHHPCERAQSWVTPGFASEDYTLDRMQQELQESISLIRGLGYQGATLSFAYPCGVTWVGEQHVSYVPLVDALFVAGRTCEWGVADPAAVSLAQTPSFGVQNVSGSDLIAHVHEAEASGGWTVLQFHGVGGDYITVSAEAHEALLAYLDSHRASVWTAPFGTVAARLRSVRAGR